MKTIVCYLLIVIPTLSLLAQKKDKSLESIAAPSMPSASIIGSQATEINKIKSMKQIETAFLTNFLDSSQNLTIPDNFSIEFNPYLLGERKNFDYKSYLDDDFKKCFIRNLSLSLTTTNSYNINDTLSSNAIGFGARTILINGKINESLKKSYLRALSLNQTNLDVDSKVRGLIDGYKSLYKDSRKNKAEIINFIITELGNDEELKQKMDGKISELIIHVEQILKNTPAPSDRVAIT
ncbi:hypothetical protein IH575_01770, partial [Candidatus Dojkabacteria bacterium]|nr:hypothetical protein [Candidatus Dojkabacteria bacterium]